MNIILIPVAIVLFSVLAYRKWSPILLGPFMALLVAVAFRLPVLDTMLGPYMEATSSFVANNFFVFFLGAIFGGVMEITGAAQSIALSMSKVTKGRAVLPLIMTITGILAYGGVSGFVVYFAMYPIALHLCRESNISRALIPGTICAGCWTWAMSMPGAPSIPNILAMKELGTSSTADAVGGFVCGGLLMYVLVFAYLEWQTRVYRQKGLFFVVDDHVEAAMKNSQDRQLPNPVMSVLPLLVILFLFNVLHIAIEFSLLAGVMFAVIILFRYGGSLHEWLGVFNKGANNSALVILNTAMVIGFASVIKQTSAFTNLVSWLGSLSMSPLVYVFITVGLCAAAAASASGGIGVALTTFKGTYLSLGVAPEIIHRLSVITCGTLDSLPHTGGIISLLNICQQNHKDAYKHMCVTCCIIPMIAAAALILWHSV